MFGVIPLYDIISIKFTINGYRWAYVIFCSTRTIISIFNCLYCLLNYYVWSPCCCFVVFLIRLPAKDILMLHIAPNPVVIVVVFLDKFLDWSQIERVANRIIIRTFFFFNSGRIRILITACNCTNETAINIL